MKTALTEQQLAALAEGAALNVQGASDGGTGAAPADAAVIDAAAAANAPVATPEAAAPEASAPVDAPAPAVVQMLQSQLQAANAQVIDLTVELRGLSAALEGAKSANAGLRAIAQASVDRMRVALGVQGVAASTDEALLAEHTALRSSFESKFKSGGVAAVSVAAPTEGAGSQPDPARQARIQATRLK